ncbi:ATP-binding protein [Streptomyces zagrosensis]|uniref:Anti-sigma regulatory factor (Ser/Thr protein kinase) n=1 Tax=Streptomyces zagrosensis TaxID=1042984 RepID=A0A7W9V1N8_9ACTN|nr:ATP-binding protein [Streptomyces zagrosensis]MBB5937979.1 anti-sigma regulatory factor (Ser/Thr protein kinase) [Streptomyces zagrosensis]
MSNDVHAPALLEPPEPPDSWSYGIDVPHDPRSPRFARHAVRMLLDEHGLAQLGETAELLTSELVTNAYRYSDGGATVRVTWSDQRLRVSVIDENPELPPPHWARPVSERSVGGRGLGLLDMCADRWDGFAIKEGVFATGGKLIWFELGTAEDKGEDGRKGARRGGDQGQEGA